MRLSLKDFIVNKTASGRRQDMADLNEIKNINSVQLFFKYEFIFFTKFCWQSIAQARW
jgi:hypothetical protein